MACPKKLTQQDVHYMSPVYRKKAQAIIGLALALSRYNLDPMTKDNYSNINSNMYF